MDRTKLMADLDKAADTVELKRAALEKAQGDAAAAIKRAGEAASVASQAHQQALADYLDLRRQLETELDGVAKAPANVTVNG